MLFKNPDQLFLKYLFSVPLPLRWLISALYLAAIAYASLSPPDGIPNLFYFPNIDKVVHFIMYFGFSILLLWTLDKASYRDGRLIEANGSSHLKNYLVVLILAGLMGFSIELFQRIMPFGRMYSIYDMYANITGALIGAGLYFFLFSFRRPGPQTLD